jgi:hypothetical protein
LPVFHRRKNVIEAVLLGSIARPSKPAAAGIECRLEAGDPANDIYARMINIAQTGAATSARLYICDEIAPSSLACGASMLNSDPSPFGIWN